jgi:serine/threonine-protein kinase
MSFTSRLGHGARSHITQDGDRVLKVPKTPAEFKRERDALSELDCPDRIIRLVAVDSKQRCLKLEYAPGESLKQILERDGRIDEAETYQIMNDVVGALQFMHSYPAAGYVHYDITAGNVIWDRQEQDATVIDFGTTYRLDRIPTEYEKELIGTPLYCSPEKWCCRPTEGKASDMFALGVLWYELLHGFAPFDPVYGNLRRQIKIPH